MTEQQPGLDISQEGFPLTTKLSDGTTASIPLDHFRAVDTALEIQLERMRVSEAMSARDAVVLRLLDAYESVRQKTAIIDQLQQDPRSDSPFPLKLAPGSEKIEIARLRDEILRLEGTIRDLRDEIQFLKNSHPQVLKSPDPPPSYEEEGLKNQEPARSGLRPQPTFPTAISRPPLRINLSPNLPHTPSPHSFSQTGAENNFSSNLDEFADNGSSVDVNKSDEPAEIIKSRNAILAVIPLPEGVPDDTLSPLSIPPSLTLQEFLSSISGPLRNSLANYRLFYASTTQWCPEREEHGYLYAPVFKCNTNPRVTTAHRWNTFDVVARMNKPTECFFNKDGTWYYAGVYRAFKMDDLSIKEWAELPTETMQAIVKDTIAGRKNTSPQNVYETNQLYAVGALRVACVGLQCVGFNNGMYKALLEQATAFAQSKWKGTSPVLPPGSAVACGLSAAGSIWNSSNAAGGPGDITDLLGSMSLLRSADRNENVLVDGVGRKR